MPTSRWRRVGWQRRQKFGDAPAPTFFEYDSESGLSPVDITFVDWGCGEVTDGISGRKTLNLELVLVAESSNSKLKGTEVVSHVKIGDLYHQFIGADRRTGERNDWVIRVEPSGDKEIV